MKRDYKIFLSAWIIGFLSTSLIPFFQNEKSFVFYMLFIFTAISYLIFLVYGIRILSTLFTFKKKNK